MKKPGFILAMLISVVSFSQSDSLRLTGDALIARQVEHLAELDESGLDLSELTAGLEYYLENPLNLNGATKKELRQLVFLDEIQIKNLIDYRGKYGEFLTIYELKAIDGIGRNTIEKIMPFVCLFPFTENTPTKKILSGKHEAFVRYQRKLIRSSGYTEAESAYAGDPARLYFRYRYRLTEKLSIGLIMEKDPGETWVSNGYGPDFLSFHAGYESKGILKEILVGDYHARFGQGLVIWSGLSFSGGSDPSSIKRYAPGISPNTSANENGFFRGLAATIGHRSLKLTTLFSCNKIDANLEYGDSAASGIYISSLPNSGYHRTSGEVADRNSLLVQSAGCNISLTGKRFKAGSTFCYTKYGYEVGKGSEPYEKFGFQGNENMVAGINYDILLRRTNVFGELAVSRKGGWAMLSGITHTSDNGSILCLLIREYRKNFQNQLARASGRRSQNANERGARVIMEFPLGRSWILNIAWDLYEFPWLSYGNDNPVRGQDLRIGLSYSAYSASRVSASYRYQKTSMSSNLRQGWLDEMTEQKKHDLKMKARFQVSESISTVIQGGYTITMRLEDGLRSAGAALMLDMHYHPPDIPIKLSGRYALFNTVDYSSRLYFYENDVLYSSSMPAYYGKGFRCYFLAKYSPAKWLDAWLRLSLTCYTDREIISSGHDEIKGNKLPELKVQIRFKI